MPSSPHFSLVALMVLLPIGPLTAAGEPIPSGDELEAAGARIGTIRVSRLNIFDRNDPAENYFLYRLANRLHVLSREEVIRRELLFREGDPYRQALIEESERNLRALTIIYHVQILPEAYHDGLVDLVVFTQDTWTMRPSVRVSRAGGNTNTGFSFSERNLLGRVKLLEVTQRKDIDRTTTGLLYSDPRLFGSRVALRALYQDSSDGLSRGLSLSRPFFSLDSRWSANVSGQHLTQTARLFQNGDTVSEFTRVSDTASASYLRSRGLENGRVLRYGPGYGYTRNVFDAETCLLDPADPGCRPPDQKFSGPTFSFERLKDRYIEVTNYNQFDRVEDFNLGNDLNLAVQLSLRSFGAQRSETILGLTDSFGVLLTDSTNLFYNASLSGRTGAGEVHNLVFSQSVESYSRMSPRQTLYARLAFDAGIHLDPQNQFLLGGDTGLRGYPSRQFAGDRRLLLTLEHRVFAPWEILRLVRIGFASFVDVGDAWYGQTGESVSDLHPDVGFGLRFGVTRSSIASVSRLDLAYSVDAKETDSPKVQVLFGTALKF
jgi:outer membrane protein assembly factor BamA